MFHVRRLILTQSSLSITKYSQVLQLLNKNINIKTTSANTNVFAKSYTKSSLSSVAEKVTSDSSTLIISESCVNRLKELGKTNQYLRVSVDSGGCSGLEYKFLLDSEITNEDKIIEKEGCKIVVDNESLGFIKGSTIDYYEELIRQGFRVINNPNSESGCSCGASFSIKI